jgi:hypothetical protein
MGRQRDDDDGRIPTSHETARDVRLREIMADVGDRLRRVCAELPATEFAALVRQIAELKVKYDDTSFESRARTPTAQALHPPDSGPASVDR